jgi:hypothetical protein
MAARLESVTHPSDKPTMKVLVIVWWLLSFSLCAAGTLLVIFSLLWADAGDAILQFLLPFLSLDCGWLLSYDDYPYWILISSDYIPRYLIPGSCRDLHSSILYAARPAFRPQRARNILYALSSLHPGFKSLSVGEDFSS